MAWDLKVYNLFFKSYPTIKTSFCYALAFGLTIVCMPYNEHSTLHNVMYLCDSINSQKGYTRVALGHEIVHPIYFFYVKLN